MHNAAAAAGLLAAAKSEQIVCLTGIIFKHDSRQQSDLLLQYLGYEQAVEHV
jgi:hypothetical protein